MRGGYEDEDSSADDKELDRETTRPLSPATATTYMVANKPGLEEEKVSYKQ